MRAVCAMVVIAPRSDLPTLSTTIRLTQVVRPLGELEKARAVLQTFHQHRRHLGVVVFQKKLGEVAKIEIHLVAVADHVAKAEIGLHGAMADDAQQRAAMRRDRHRPRLDRQGERMVVAAGNIFVDVKSAVAVGTADTNIVALGDLADLGLRARPLPGRLR